VMIALHDETELRMLLTILILSCFSFPNIDRDWYFYWCYSIEKESNQIDESNNSYACEYIIIIINELYFSSKLKIDQQQLVQIPSFLIYSMYLTVISILITILSLFDLWHLRHIEVLFSIVKRQINLSLLISSTLERKKKIIIALGYNFAFRKLLIEYE